MSKRFTQGTPLYPFECMMQQTPIASMFENTDKKLKGRYNSMIRAFIKDKDMNPVKERIFTAASKMHFEDFAFISEEHRDAFFSHFVKYKKGITDGEKKVHTAVIYLLSTCRCFDRLLEKCIGESCFTLPDKMKGYNDEMSYDLYQAAKKIMGQQSKLEDEDLLEDGVLEDAVLCLIVNAMFIAEHGLMACQEERPKIKKQSVRSPIQRNQHIYYYNGQAVRIK